MSDCVNIDGRLESPWGHDRILCKKCNGIYTHIWGVDILTDYGWGSGLDIHGKTYIFNIWCEDCNFITKLALTDSKGSLSLHHSTSYPFYSKLPIIEFHTQNIKCNTIPL